MKEGRTFAISSPRPVINNVHLFVDSGKGAVPCTLMNFSQKGLRFICREELLPGCTCGCRFSTVRTVKKELLFPIKVRHCSKRDETYEVGAEIVAVHNDASLNFFRSVIDALQAAFP